MSEELPPYVHKKIAKGRAYYYFSLGYDRGSNTVRLTRLPDITDPLFEKRVSELHRQRGLRGPLRRRIRQEGRPYVYFIGAETGPVKIGVSTDPDSRCKAMQVGAPDDVFVLARTPGGVQLEKAYHRRFSFARVRGEWFERRPEIAAEITRLTTAERDGNK